MFSIIQTWIVQGRIKFSDNERLGIVDIKQYIGGSYQEVCFEFES